ncbi:FAD-dependent oxidoreductase [Novosphingobium sp. BL-52-GroH]|uniref:FAD-dependent oxidoreductase n=1 Tax=Novosphingobium sp. BL-52-GroH TaxID=3349877 RepID=UPI003850071C
MMKKTRVLVAGAGPVGAVAAYRLAQMGIDVILIEPNTHCPDDMRASTMHPPTLDMLEELGVLDDLVAVGLKAPVYQYRNRKTDNVISLDMTEIGDVVRHPFRLQCEQFKLARLLTGLLATHPHAQVLFNHRLLSYEQDAKGVTCKVEGPLAIETIACDYLIGADGASSTVRKLTGIEFEGFTYPERFLTLSTDYPVEDHHPGLANVSYMSDEAEWCVLLRVPGLWRVLVPSHEQESDASLLSDAKKTSVFKGLVPDGESVKTHHRTLYRVHQRVAASFRKGRVLLAGDAAHLNNPLGGFGMNSGIHDAWNLTGKLRDILLDGGDADALLDRYDRQRRTISREFVQAQTIRNKAAMEADPGAGKSAQERHMEKLVADATLRHEYMMQQAMVRSLEREGEIL